MISRLEYFFHLQLWMAKHQLIIRMLKRLMTTNQQSINRKLSKFKLKKKRAHKTETYKIMPTLAHNNFRCHIFNRTTKWICSFILLKNKLKFINEFKKIKFKIKSHHTVSCAKNSLLKPKSVSTIWPSLSKRIFSNLISL